MAEINSSSATNRRDDGDAMSVSSDDSGANYHRASGSAKINDKLKIVSTQSTARPGAVVELEPIEDAKQVMLQTYNFFSTFVKLQFIFFYSKHHAMKITK